MLTFHQPLFEHMNKRKTKSDCIKFDYVVTGDTEIETNDHPDEERNLQKLFLTKRDKISLLNDLTVCSSYFFYVIT